MKTLILLLTILILPKLLLAAPVVNENMAIKSVVTIYPDSVDPNLYYFTPQFMGICLNENNQPIFSYTEFHPSGWFMLSRGLMMTTLCIKDHAQEMEDAELEIVKKNPQAHFVGLPFSKSSLSFSDSVFQNVIEKNSCSHIGGVVGQEQSCAVIFNPRGKDLFLNTLRSGLGIVFQFDYVFDGVLRLPSGLKATQANFSIAVRISKSDFVGQLDDYLPKEEDPSLPPRLAR